MEAPDGLIVWGNERLLREAVVNYITNAIKYTPEGGDDPGAGRREGARVRQGDGDGRRPGDRA